MKKATIISVGNELLNGQTVDTNSTWMCAELISVGIATHRVYVVGDDVGLIVDCLKQAWDEADIILLTGGLGPTDDDITRNALAEFLGTELIFNQKIAAKMKQFFDLRGYEMSQKNLVQAYLPAGTVPIDNNMGTAAGILCRQNEKLIAALPGVPAEMKKMFSETVLGQIERAAVGGFVVIKKLRCIGTGESTLAEMLGDLMNRQRNPLINCTVDTGIITLHIVAGGKNKQDAEEMAGRDEKTLRQILGELVFGVDGQSLAEVVAEKMKNAGQTLAVAESCTGGLLAKMITDIPGASDFFTYGWVTYSNDAKISQLNVSKDVIEKHGAVDPEVASAMARGARMVSGADWAVAVTGIAGPGGGSEQKPVGLVYIAVSSQNDTKIEKFNFYRRDRDFIRTRAAQTALNLLRLSLGV